MLCPSLSVSHLRSLKKHAGLFSKSRVGLEISASLTISSQGMAYSNPNEGLTSQISVPVTLIYRSMGNSLLALILVTSGDVPAWGKCWRKPSCQLHLLQRTYVASFGAQSHGQLEILSGSTVCQVGWQCVHMAPHVTAEAYIPCCSCDLRRLLPERFQTGVRHMSCEPWSSACLQLITSTHTPGRRQHFHQTCYMCAGQMLCIEARGLWLLSQGAFD